MTEPPLYASAIQGVRTWTVANDRDGTPLLAAAAQSMLWHPGEPARAVCIAGRGRRRATHIAPAPECSCGIYAYHPWAPQGRTMVGHVLRGGPGRVAGTVSAWGHVEVHLDGFRAEFARPETLFIRDPEEALLIRSLAKRYGAKVVEVPDFKALRHHLRSVEGISRKQAREYFLETLELVLHPEADAFEGTDGEFVTGAGYRLDSDSDALEVRIRRHFLSLNEFAVAGVSFRHEALQSPAFMPGSEVVLVREPDNEHDPYAVGVWDEQCEIQVGYVPRREARRLCAALRMAEVKRAVVTRHFRGMATGERSGLRVLTSPTEKVDFVGLACSPAADCTDDDDIPF